MRAVHTDCYCLRPIRDFSSTVTQQFAVSHMLRIFAREAEPCSDLRPLRKRLSNRTRLIKRRQRFECKHIGPLPAFHSHQDPNPLTMEFDKFVETALVVAVIFRAIVQRRAVWTQRCRDNNSPLGKRLCRMSR